MNIICSFNYYNSTQFRKNIILLIQCVSKYNFLCYGNYECLMKLNNYYEIQCIDIMYQRMNLIREESEIYVK